MKKLALLLALFTTYLSAHEEPVSEIIEVTKMEETFPHIDGNTLIVLDIDNTLIHPAQMLGSDEWFRYRVGFYKNKGLEFDPALEKALAEWMSVQCITQMELAEENLDKIVADWQNKGYDVIGLTTRGLGMATRTIAQLDSVNIDLERTALKSNDFLFDNGRSCLYRKGILFTANTHKGRALETLINHLDYQPKKVVFINDKRSHLVPVQTICQNLGIDYVGCRYGALDQRVASFDAKVADIQFERYRSIISDEEARKAL